MFTLYHFWLGGSKSHCALVQKERQYYQIEQILPSDGVASRRICYYTKGQPRLGLERPSPEDADGEDEDDAT